MGFPSEPASGDGPARELGAGEGKCSKFNAQMMSSINADAGW
jgi:hypothetical protein